MADSSVADRHSATVVRSTLSYLTAVRPFILTFVARYGWCGSTSAHCKEGCDAAHGTCTTTTVPTTNKVSPDGSCGGSKGYTCIGATDGDCCSQYVSRPQLVSTACLLIHSPRYGYCGKTSAYCGKGCNSAFGKCNNQSPSKVASSALQTSTRSVAVTSPSSSAKVTQDGRCGNANGATGGFSCAGSSYGDCCSKYSYCGSTKVDLCAKASDMTYTDISRIIVELAVKLVSASVRARARRAA
jgi:hypothetical protein